MQIRFASDPQKSACLCFPNAGIKGMYHNAWLLFMRDGLSMQPRMDSNSQPFFYFSFLSSGIASITHKNFFFFFFWLLPLFSVVLCVALRASCIQAGPTSALQQSIIFQPRLSLPSHFHSQAFKSPYTLFVPLALFLSMLPKVILRTSPGQLQSKAKKM